MVKFPPSLTAGDKVMIVSPAGKVDSEIVYKAQQTLAGWGLDPIISAHALCDYGRFAGRREERLSDLQEALLNPAVKAIFCARGGYGAVQLIEDLPVEVIRNNPKWLIGYSDITLLHALFSRSGIVSLHAPMAQQLGCAPEDEISQMIRNILFGGVPSYTISGHDLNRIGYAEGQLVGGNLAVLSGLHGSSYDFIYDGSILFIEDIGESPYKIERMLYNLRLAGVFDRINGLVVGQFSDCTEDPLMNHTIYENIRDLVNGYLFPVCFNFPCGHVAFNVPLPEGAKTILEVRPRDAHLRFIK
ncbi:MAG: LD-carboxypeptidase [Bacteroidales bacterium]